MIIFLTTGNELHLKLRSQSSTSNVWQGHQKKLC